MKTIEQCSQSAIKKAFYAAASLPVCAKGASIFEQIRAVGGSVAYSKLEADHGTPNANLGRFCKEVAKSLGVANPPSYALFETTKEDGEYRLTIMSCVSEALAS